MFRWNLAGGFFSLRGSRIWIVAGIITVLWSAAWAHVAIERKAVREAIFRETNHFAHLLEERVVRAVEKIDHALKFLRRSYGRTAGNVSWAQLLSEAAANLNPASTISIIDENGTLLATTAPLPIRTGSLASTEYHRTHANEVADILLISRPIQERSVDARSVMLTRRFDKPDGNWGGVIAISLDPMLVARLYDTIPMRRTTEMTLMGRDSIVLLASGETAPEPGRDLSLGPIFRKLATRSHGSFWQSGNGTEDGRVTSYRPLGDVPLVVAVSAADEESSPDFVRHRRITFAVAGLLSLILLISAAVASWNAINLAKIRHALSNSETRARSKSVELELTLNNMSQGIMMVDGEGRLAVLNRQAVTLLGLPASYLKHPPAYADLIEHQHRMDHGNIGDWSLVQRLSEDARARSETARMVAHEWARPDGTVLEVRSQLLPDGGFVRTFTDVTHRYQAEARINHLSRHDTLTQLTNRAMFREMLECALLSPGQKGIALLCIDLDLFRGINDALGHNVGDKLLQTVAGRLQQVVGKDDIIARLGGDEFALAHRIDSSGDAAKLAECVIGKLSQPCMIDGHNISISARIGIAVATDDARTAEDLLLASNLALREAKTADRGVYRFYESEMQTRSRQRRLLELDLRRGLTENQFELHYQPLYRLDTQEIIGFEAMIRWRHPQRGLVPPSDFVPIAEDIGLIEQIGAWALEEAIQELSRLPGHIKIAVNLSPLQFRSRDLVQRVTSVLAGAGVAAHRLVLEITESTLMCGDNLTLQQLHELRSLGLRIAMDDFGTGYSSLSYLMRFPFDSIKIDKSFVGSIGHVPGSMAIIRAITELASSLGMATIAEGVETREQLQELIAIGCSEGQGYWWSRPLPAREARALCDRQSTHLPKAVAAA